MYSLRGAIGYLLDARAKWKLNNRADIKIAANSRVACSNILWRKGCRLDILGQSVIEGGVVFEREGAAVRVGKRVFIGAGSRLISAQEITIGDDVLISWGCTVIDHNGHSADWNERSNDVTALYRQEKDWSNVARRRVVICERSWIGFNSIILKGVTIGEGAIVGAGSVVTKDVERYTVVAGNPATLVRRLEI